VLPAWPLTRVRARARAAELEAAIVASLADAEADGARPGGPPPAAKFAVRALRTEALTAERLDALGGAGVECCVCRCAGQAAAPPGLRSVRGGLRWLSGTCQMAHGVLSLLLDREFLAPGARSAPDAPGRWAAVARCAGRREGTASAAPDVQAGTLVAARSVASCEAP